MGIYQVDQKNNMNDLSIYNADGADEPIRSAAVNLSPVAAQIEVVFGSIEDRLVDEIMRWPAVVGCTAWLTNEPILEALATRAAASFVVQKEDFLRPDSGSWSKQKLLRLYKNVPGIEKWCAGLHYNYCDSDRVDGVLCAGFFSKGRRLTPRMHHKFMVFCEPSQTTMHHADDGISFVPRKVWTGSFNPTQNATQSLENAVIIQSDEIARSYMDEWRRIVGISEKLDWKSEFIAPDFRIGT